MCVRLLLPLYMTASNKFNIWINKEAIYLKTLASLLYDNRTEVITFNYQRAWQQKDHDQNHFIVHVNMQKCYTFIH